MGAREIFEPRQLSSEGRCCGRKPLFYKTRRGLGSVKDPHHFCTRCCAEYTVSGEQRPNWAWLETEGGFKPAHSSDSDYVAAALRSLES